MSPLSFTFILLFSLLWALISTQRARCTLVSRENTTRERRKEERLLEDILMLKQKERKHTLQHKVENCRLHLRIFRITRHHGRRSSYVESSRLQGESTAQSNSAYRTNNIISKQRHRVVSRSSCAS